jgi:hypothetical protein
VVATHRSYASTHWPHTQCLRAVHILLGVHSPVCDWLLLQLYVLGAGTSGWTPASRRQSGHVRRMRSCCTWQSSCPHSGAPLHPSWGAHQRNAWTGGTHGRGCTVTSSSCSAKLALVGAVSGAAQLSAVAAAKDCWCWSVRGRPGCAAGFVDQPGPLSLQRRPAPRTRQLTTVTQALRHPNLQDVRVRTLKLLRSWCHRGAHVGLAPQLLIRIVSARVPCLADVVWGHT